jgi:thioredoxin reductase
VNAPRSNAAQSVLVVSHIQSGRQSVGRQQPRLWWNRSATFGTKLCAGEEIAIIGGGNSAGQGAVSLAHHASRDPETGWLRGSGVALDADGFAVTGASAQTAEERAPVSLVSTMPGVHAVGDVRSGSVKRVGGAIGEGAAVVALIHENLSKSR